MDTHNLKIFPTPESVVRCIVAIVDLPPCTPPGSASHSIWYYQDQERPDQTTKSSKALNSQNGVATNSQGIAQ